MDEEMKKPIMIGVIVVCLILAGIITFATRSGGSSDYKKIGRWVKCRNPECAAEYQIPSSEYIKQVTENVDPAALRAMELPALVCRECSEESVYAAIKCEECGLVFEENSVEDEVPDRCPECGYSKIEEEGY